MFFGNESHYFIGGHLDGNDFAHILLPVPHNRLLGPFGQGFSNCQPHAVDPGGAPGGITADARLERSSAVKGFERIDVMQNRCELIDLGLPFAGDVMVEPANDLADDLFEMNRAALVDGLHQSADIGNVRRLAGGIILQIENFQSRNHALAVIDQLQHLTRPSGWSDSGSPGIPSAVAPAGLTAQRGLAAAAPEHPALQPECPGWRSPDCFPAPSNPSTSDSRSNPLVCRIHCVISSRRPVSAAAYSLRIRAAAL